MITQMQKKAADIMVRDLNKGGRPKTKSQIVKEAGYSKTIQTFPSRMMKTQGFRDALTLSLKEAGLTPNKVAGRLRWLIDGAEKDSETATLGAIREISKLTGAYAPIKTKSKLDVDVIHHVEDDEGNYAKFLKEQNQKREIIEGEIV